jgi:hypothetical protein
MDLSSSRSALHKSRHDHYNTASEATGCHTHSFALILIMGLLSVASGRFARDTVLVARREDKFPLFVV